MLQALRLDRGTLPAPGSGSAEEAPREASGSESDPEPSPLRGVSREPPQNSPGANRERDGGKPDEGPRRRLSSAFPPKSPDLAPSPAGKRHPAKARNRGAGAPKDKPGTGRKACVSGLSVSRWARNEAQRHGPRKPQGRSLLSRPADSSLYDFQLRPEPRKQPVSAFQQPSPRQAGLTLHLLTFSRFLFLRVNGVAWSTTSDGWVFFFNKIF